MKPSFYQRLSKALTYFIEYTKDEEMVEFNKVLNEDELRILELENELGEKQMEIKELKRHIETLESQRYENDLM